MRWVMRSVLSRRKSRASCARSKSLSVAALCEREPRVLITMCPRLYAKNGGVEKRALRGPKKSSRACLEILRGELATRPIPAAGISLVAFRRRTFARDEGLIEGTGELEVRSRK